MTYRVGGVQYVAVMAGYGGGLLYEPFPQASAAYRFGNEDRIVTFAWEGGNSGAPAVPRSRAAHLAAAHRQRTSDLAR